MVTPNSYYCKKANDEYYQYIRGNQQQKPIKSLHKKPFTKPLPEECIIQKIRQVFWLVHPAAPSHPQGAVAKITEENSGLTATGIAPDFNGIPFY
jgi:hypothetical protein